MADLPSYSYTSLPADRHTRVLTIAPSDEGDELRCRLSQICLDDNPEYEAISYAWGDSKATVEVLCDGAKATITTNGYSALRRLRWSSEPRTLWLDALCINQNDIGERNSQVKMMRDIFATASKVIIWLGEEDDDTPEAIRQLTAWSNLRHYGLQVWRQWSPNYFDEISLDQSPFDYIDVGDALPQTLTRDKAVALINRDWSQRLWVLQETVVAKALEVRCGSFVLAWESMFRSLYNMAFMGSTVNGDTARNGPWHFAQAGVSRIMFHDPISSEVPLNLENLLIVHRYRNCAEPKDKIYAVLGISKDASDSAAITVDYSQSVDDVYISVANFIIKKKRLISHLGLAGPYGQPNNLPSWVPDWRRNPNDGPPGPLFSSLSTLTRLFSVTGLWFPHILETEFKTELGVMGIYIDEITATGPGSEHPDWYKLESESEMNNLVEYLLADDGTWFSWYRQHLASHPTTDTVDQDMEARARYRKIISLEHIYHKVTADSTHEAKRDFPSWVRGNGNMPTMDISDVTFNMKSEWLRSLSRSIVKRRLCFTRSGKFGLAPENVKEGDTLVGIAGAPLIYALRPAETIGVYRFLGESYLEGLMDGETLFEGSTPLKTDAIGEILDYRWKVAFNFKYPEEATKVNTAEARVSNQADQLQQYHEEGYSFRLMDETRVRNLSSSKLA